MSGKVNEYFLSRDHVDLNRLNLQHYLYKDIFGYSIHPTIPRHKPNLKVGDIGTGTGIWLKSILPELDSSASLTGLDTDVSQAGPPQWLPHNVTIRNWDINTDVPTDLVGRFDIINLRLLGLVIQNDPAPVLRNVIKMLKPNGYIQWCETDQESWRIKTVSSDTTTTNLTELWRQTSIVASGLMALWVKSLESSFEAEGLQDVVADWRTGDNHTLMAMHWCNMPLYDMIVQKLRPSDTKRADSFANLIRESLQESKMGAMYVFDRVVVVGRKTGNA